MIELGGADFWTRLATNPAALAAEICLIDVSRLDEALQRHASLRAWVNATYEVARVAEERARWELTKARARAFLHAKGRPDPETKKPKIVALLEAEVETDSAVVKATKDVLEVSEKRAALRATADALEDRKDMLVQIAAKRRAEMRDYS